MPTKFSEFKKDIEYLPRWMARIYEKLPTKEEQCNFIDEYYSLDEIDDNQIAMAAELDSLHEFQLFMAVENNPFIMEEEDEDTILFCPRRNFFGDDPEETETDDSPF